jgi:phosphoserine phosphatase
MQPSLSANRAINMPSWVGPQRPVETGSVPSPPSDISQARILIVDDLESNVRLLQRMLTRARYTNVEATQDPCAVFELHRRNQYDLILLDLEMPRMSGFEVLESLKSIHLGEEIPVLALASHDSEKVRALKAGARDFLTKPFDITEVLARIAIMLEIRLLQVAMRQRHQAIERDVALAAEICRALLPSSLPRCPGYEFAALNRCAADASGDVFDVIPQPDGGQLVLLADATGHGIGPALSATQLRSMVRMAIRLGASLDQIAAEAARQLAADLPSDRFVTAFLGEIDPVAHRLDYVAPGQGPLLHWHAAAGVAEWRNASSPPFGVALPPFDRPPPMLLDPGDIVLLATDGIYERTSPAGKLFGEAGIEAVVREHGQQSAEGLAAALQAATDAHAASAPPEDDATVVIVKRRD